MYLNIGSDGQWPLTIRACRCSDIERLFPDSKLLQKELCLCI